MKKAQEMWNEKEKSFYSVLIQHWELGHGKSRKPRQSWVALRLLSMKMLNVMMIISLGVGMGLDSDDRQK